MAEKTVRVVVNIATPRFAWYMAGACIIRANGLPLPRIIRAAYLYYKILRMVPRHGLS